MRDETPGLQVSEVLAESESRFAALFEHSADALLVVARDGRIVMSNAAASRLFGYSAAELATLAVEHLIPAKHRERHRGLRASYHQAPQSRLMNECSALTALTSTGAEVPVEVGLGPVTVGGVPMVLTSIRDISSRVAANARLLEAERRSAESQKLEAIGRLAGGVAHDFNNLMTVVIVSAESLLAETRDSEAKEVLREIVLAGQRAAELTEQLLTFARNQRGQPERVVLNDRLRSFSRLLTRLVGERVSLRFEFGEGVAPIVLTPPNVDQVVLNLVLNSRDAMPHGGNIVVRTLTEAVAGRHWSLIEVQDDGLGIDDGIRQHIFEPFFTTKPVGRGSGLGLATVYGIVKQAGGDITVTSARGRGSTFRVRFPADG